MPAADQRTRVFAENAAQKSGARPAGRGNKSPNLTIRERVTLFGCAVLVVGSLVLDAIREWRR